MKRSGFKPTLREDGTLDPACFARAGLRWVRQWLEGRLAGNDPYFPIDPRYDEDPEALVAGVLRDAGSDHPGSALIAKAVLQLLDQANALAPDVPPSFSSLIRLCERTPLLEVGAWFRKQVEGLAEDPAKMEVHWGSYELTKEIVFAAIVQSPGLPTTASRESWLALLRTQRYATLALLGLGTSFREEGLHLKEWWHFCPAADRERDLDQMIFTALKFHTGQNGGNTAQAILSSVGRSYPSDLKKAIDRALEQNGGDPAFDGAAGNGAASHHSHESAMNRAGLRREILFAEAS